MPPIKFSKSTKKFLTRGSSKYVMEHNYIKCKSNADLIEAYNKEGQKPKLRAKVRVEIDRRNKLGLSKIVFK